MKRPRNRGEMARKTNLPNIKTENEISLMAESCRIVAETLLLVEKHIKPGVETIELDRIAEDYIRSQDGNPAFKGYRIEHLVFPGSLCISVNEQVVHGIPGPSKLNEGDIVSIDCGCEKGGYFGDHAKTFPVGKIDDEKQKLLRVTREALMFGIEQAVEGNKLYDISGAIQRHCEENGFSLTRELVGHGIGSKLHEEPPVPNFIPPLLYRKKYPNLKLEKGYALAIEPMVHAGIKDVMSLSDGWTVITADKKPAAHFEHTVIVDNGKARILTLLD